MSCGARRRTDRVAGAPGAPRPPPPAPSSQLKTARTPCARANSRHFLRPRVPRPWKTSLPSGVTSDHPSPLGRSVSRGEASAGAASAKRPEAIEPVDLECGWYVSERRHLIVTIAPACKSESSAVSEIAKSAACPRAATTPPPCIPGCTWLPPGQLSCRGRCLRERPRGTGVTDGRTWRTAGAERRAWS